MKQAENVLVPPDAIINHMYTIDVLSFGLGILLVIVIWVSLSPRYPENRLRSEDKDRIFSTTNMLRVGLCSLLLIGLIVFIIKRL